jgi:hypothetical protein
VLQEKDSKKVILYYLIEIILMFDFNISKNNLFCVNFKVVILTNPSSLLAL